MDIEPFFKESLEPFRGKNIFIGFSGGIDSTTLLLMLKNIQTELDLKLQAVHFQHNIRGASSKADADWCSEFCKSHQIPYKQIELSVPEDRFPGESIETAARRLRTIHWQKLTESIPGSVVALGHHADDRIENLFMRLARGSNSSGLSSLRKVQNLGSVTIIRPLLAFSKAKLEKVMAKFNITDWREDESNSDCIYTRNFFRNLVLPEIYQKLDFSHAGIMQSVKVLEEDARFIETVAADTYKEISALDAVNIEFWHQLPHALFGRVLRLWLSEQLGYDFVPGRNLIERFQHELDKLRTQENLTCGRILIPLNIKDMYLKISSKQCCLYRRLPEDNQIMLWKWQKENTINWQDKVLSITYLDRLPDNPGEPDRAFFSAASLPSELIIRNWLPGDKMVPFGSHTSVKLKKIFVDRKVYSETRNNYPLLCLPDGEIIWIPEIRHSDYGKVSSNETKIIEIRITHN
jgi:tRNA(Ile)-lysidine synthase